MHTNANLSINYSAYVEWAAGTEGLHDASILDRKAQEIKELAELGIQVGVVCWYELRCGRPHGDAGTVMNGLRCTEMLV